MPVVPWCVYKKLPLCDETFGLAIRRPQSQSTWSDCVWAWRVMLAFHGLFLIFLVRFLPSAVLPSKLWRRVVASPISFLFRWMAAQRRTRGPWPPLCPPAIDCKVQTFIKTIYKPFKRPSLMRSVTCIYCKKSQIDACPDNLHQKGTAKMNNFFDKKAPFW